MQMKKEAASSAAQDVKRRNYRSIYDRIYRERRVTKKTLAEALHLSMPTVTQDLAQMLADGLIAYIGHEDSTGGRKPELIGPVTDARIAAGLEVIHEMARLIVIDLYGQTLLDESLPVTFENSEAYFQTLCRWVNGLLHGMEYPAERILGVGIAIQGLLLPDQSAVCFGRLLSDGIRLTDFSGRLDWPCTLIHDVEAAAAAELWYQPELSNAIYISLNRNTGGALMIDGNVYGGKRCSSGTIEHMCIHPNGRRCYCGKRGCLDAYCSAAALEQAAGEPLDRFFENLRLGQRDEKKIWHSWLKDLALAIDNARMVVRGDILIGGYVRDYMRDEDFALLHTLIMKQTFFETDDLTIRRGLCREQAAALGGALLYIRAFLGSI